MKTILSATAIALSCLLTSTLAHASVWPVTQQWSPQVEAQYQDWVKNSWSITFFEQAGPLQGVKLDCADTVYSMRMFYSYKNGLPFAIRSPGSRALISNDMTRFDGIADPDQRFRQFALFMYNITATETLPEDSYAVAITRDTVHSGIFMRSDKASHHSWTVQDLSVAGQPHLIFASRPALTVLLSQSSYPSMQFLWGHEDDDNKPDMVALNQIGSPSVGVGYRMYRYPQDLLKPEAQVPGFSMDQFTMKEINWAYVVQHKLALRPETDEETAARVISDACSEVTARVPFVQLGVDHSSSINRCMSSDEFDDYSTPSKDDRGVTTMSRMLSNFKNHNKGLTPETRQSYAAILAGTDNGELCPNQEIMPGVTLSLGQLAKLYVSHKLSSNPNDTLAVRWGLMKRDAASLGATCPDYTLIAHQQAALAKQQAALAKQQALALAAQQAQALVAPIDPAQAMVAPVAQPLGQ